MDHKCGPESMKDQVLDSSCCISSGWIQPSHSFTNSTEPVVPVWGINGPLSTGAALFIASQPPRASCGDIHREKKRTRYRPIRDHRAGGTASAALTFVRCPRRFRHGAVAPERALGVRKGFLQFHVVVFLLKPHGSSACVLADGSFFCFTRWQGCEPRRWASSFELSSSSTCGWRKGCRAHAQCGQGREDLGDTHHDDVKNKTTGPVALEFLSASHTHVFLPG